MKRHENGEKHLSFFDCNKEIVKLKNLPETAWLKKMDSQLLIRAAQDLDQAYQNFFNSCSGKRRGPKLEKPRFKSKFDNRQSYRTTGGHAKLDFETGKIFLPKFKKDGGIDCVFSRKFTGTITNVTISKNPSGQYFVSILVKEEIALQPMTGREVGIDLGLKDLLILSTGHKFDHPQQMLAKAKLAVKKSQKKHSRTKKGSKNREKMRVKVARAYQRLTNIRNNYYHLVSRWLVDNFDTIVLEDLNVNGMLKNRKLSRKIHETAWSTLVGMIAYKSGWAGKTFHKINRWYPSSKTCSCCGYKLESLPLSVREWDCPSCNTHHDRDLNASLNILQVGLNDLYETKPSDTQSELGAIPATLMKHTSQIKRSVQKNSLYGDEVTTQPQG